MEQLIISIDSMLIKWIQTVDATMNRLNVWKSHCTFSSSYDARNMI